MNEQKTSAQLKTEYEAAKARLAELNALKAKLETDLKATDAEIRELVGFYRDGGKIKYLKRNWQTAQLREETEKLPKVRVKGKYSGGDDWRFVKKTPKRIYLRNTKHMRDEYWDLDGGTSWHGTIHADDLAAILEGRIK